MAKYMNIHGKIENQYNSSWCSAFSTSSYLESYFYRVYGELTELSPLFLIRNSKLVDGNKTSTGTYLTKLMDEATKKGCCARELYHEDSDKDWLDNKFNEPSKEAFENAKKYTPYKKKEIEVTVASMKEAVVNNGGCVLALNIFKTYYDPFQGCYIRSPKGNETRTEGRHAIYVCGFDDDHECTYDGGTYKGFFILAESYGTRTITKGYKFLPYKFIEDKVGGLYSTDRFIDEAYVFTYKEKPKFSNICDNVEFNFPKKTIQLTVGSKVAYVDGQAKTLSYPPIVEDGRTFVPFRFLAEAFNASVSFNQDTKEIKIFSKEPNYLIIAQLGNKVIEKSGYGKVTKIECDVAPFVKNGVTLIPIRAVSELLGCKVNYSNGVITIEQ